MAEKEILQPSAPIFHFLLGFIFGELVLKNFLEKHTRNNGIFGVLFIRNAKVVGIFFSGRKGEPSNSRTTCFCYSIFENGSSMYAERLFGCRNLKISTVLVRAE